MCHARRCSEGNAKITTIEGLSPNGSHPIQKAWQALDVPQCGFCQSGMIMAATALLKDKPNPTDKDIDDAMTNICRCGTYNRVRAAIHVAAKRDGRCEERRQDALKAELGKTSLNIEHVEGAKA